MNNIELIALEIISNVGMAKSLIIEALREGRKNNFEIAQQKMEEADKYFSLGHKAHSDLIQKEAKGEKIDFSILIMHTEDQLMSTETIRCLVVEMLEIIKCKAC